MKTILSNFLLQLIYRFGRAQLDLIEIYTRLVPYTCDVDGQPICRWCDAKTNAGYAFNSGLVCWNCGARV